MKCDNCGNYYFGNLYKCPRCGLLKKNNKKTSNIGLIIFYSFFIFFFIIFFISSCEPNFVRTLKKLNHTTNLKIENHPKIGKKISFPQPLGYIIRKHPSIVPIVRDIEKELTKMHPKLDSEKVNQHIPPETQFTFVEVHFYEDAFNGETTYYVLESKGVKYILSEFTLKYLSKPINVIK